MSPKKKIKMVNIHMIILKFMFYNISIILIFGKKNKMRQFYAYIIF